MYNKPLYTGTLKWVTGSPSRVAPHYNRLGLAVMEREHPEPRTIHVGIDCGFCHEDRHQDWFSGVRIDFGIVSGECCRCEHKNAGAVGDAANVSQIEVLSCFPTAPTTCDDAGRCGDCHRILRVCRKMW